MVAKKSVKIEPGQNVTQQQIADLVGCSQNTVALALRQSTRISEKMRKRVLEVADSLAYRPNLAARGLRAGRSGLVGVFTGTLDYVRQRYIQHILTGLDETRFKPIVGQDQLSHAPWYNAPWIDTFLELRVEALISFAWHDTAKVPQWHKQVPVIFSGFDPEPDVPCDQVSMDRRDAAIMATKYLIEQGHRRITMVTPYLPPLQVAGYETTMKEAGLKPEISLVGNKPHCHMNLNGLIKRLQRKRNRATALFVIDSPLAADIINATQIAGICVPDDVAILGYDHMLWADKLAIPLTTIEQPIEDLVKQTIKVLDSRLENPALPPQHSAVPFHIVPRASV